MNSYELPSTIGLSPSVSRSLCIHHVVSDPTLLRTSGSSFNVAKLRTSSRHSDMQQGHCILVMAKEA